MKCLPLVIFVFVSFLAVVGCGNIFFRGDLGGNGIVQTASGFVSVVQVTNMPDGNGTFIDVTLITGKKLCRTAQNVPKPTRKPSEHWRSPNKRRAGKPSGLISPHHLEVQRAGARTPMLLPVSMGTATSSILNSSLKAESHGGRPKCRTSWKSCYELCQALAVWEACKRTLAWRAVSLSSGSGFSRQRFSSCSSDFNPSVPIA